MSVRFQWPGLLSPIAMIGALLVAGISGVVAGFYPALRASRLDPIEALRFDSAGVLGTRYANSVCQLDLARGVASGVPGSQNLARGVAYRVPDLRIWPDWWSLPSIVGMTKRLDWAALEREAARRFGVRRFRPGQRELMEAVLRGRDALGMCPPAGASR